MSLLAYLKTVRHLRPIQVVSRISILARRRLLQGSGLLRRRYRTSVPASGMLAPLPLPLPPPPPASAAEVDGIREGLFSFLNRRVELRRPGGSPAGSRISAGSAGSIADSGWSSIVEADLPVWLAYILSPGSGPVAGRFCLPDAAGLRADVDAHDTSYRIVCDGEQLEVTRR